jgi:hypothetical protein
MSHFSLPLDHIALAGYTLIFAFSLYKLSDTFARPVDLLANLLLLTGLGSLITYHFRKIRDKKDETNDMMQKRVREVAHSTIVVFFLLTLTPMSTAVFRFYDVFALVAHATLLVTVMYNMSQLAGVGLLAMYFAFGFYQKIDKGGMEMLNLVGRALLLVFFVVSFGTGLAKLM